MKKSILAACILLASISTFAQDSRTQTTGEIRQVQASKISNIFSVMDVKAGDEIGKCQVVAVGKTGAKGTKFELQLNNTSITVEGNAQLHISVDGQTRVLIAESEANKTGKVKQLRFGWAGTPESSIITELSIITKQYNDRGQVKYVARESIDCAN